ncbi:MAG: DUF2029 domain-containing protein [Gemmatimonadetes bacterium]|uniref:DUF2029 domain-containing protein n=1 Tax=Candidatus Kutchimonas denitrificans TaxID=3056748 RepID=A0AAE4Z607_9BACT|nr:DUF2029 domain-containing protein [Gemmatimonadota bacterium]NIR74465.1 DUF2029 domain-containing protein [Candidatus Kutchimonas denitrificans]NIS00861.1 DUF2029 domain-containing protein [Gemmatimonadota bacterium]NIT66484.1 DUF2029 domain-containing protein [Gemmatimonadota bacterium]NIU52115.1 DUF2029 domain-containing protein [Gemmatimonadota bacterium]
MNLERSLAALKRPLTSRPARWILAALIVLLVAFLWYNMVRRALSGHSSQFEEFVSFSRDLVYDGVNIYREYPPEKTVTKYPPFFGVLFAPLVPLPGWLAASLWFWLSLGFAVAATWLGVRTVNETPGRELGRSYYVIPFVLTAGIIGSNLETAQVNTLVLLLTAAALYSFRWGRDLRAGLLLGAVTALKLTPGLFIVYFLYKRAYRVVLGAGAGIVICWLLVLPPLFGFADFPAIMAGWWADLRGFISEGALAEGVIGFRHTNQSLSAAFHRFFTHVPADGGRGPDYYVNFVSLSLPTAEWIVKVMAVAIVVFLAWICRTPPGDRSRLALSFEYSLVWIATLFISPISWINHYVHLLFPYVVAVYYLKTRVRDDTWRLLWWSVAASFVLVASSASRLPQAWSLPFFGAVVLAAGLAVALRAERGQSELAAGAAASGGIA